MYGRNGTKRRLGGTGRLSVVLTPSRRVQDGEPVDVRLGDGRIVENCYSKRLDDGKIRVFLPEGVS